MGILIHILVKRPVEHSNYFLYTGKIKANPQENERIVFFQNLWFNVEKNAEEK